MKSEQNPCLESISHSNHCAALLSADTTSVIALRPGPQPIPTRQHNFVYSRKPRSPFLTLRNAPSIPPFKRVTQHRPDQRAPKTYPHRYDEENAKRAGFGGKENNGTVRFVLFSRNS